ncbi:MAG: OmpA family protein [Pedobacter sp.]|nr:MAG: OmpA family protein [Pedobacter sp.]
MNTLKFKLFVSAGLFAAMSVFMTSCKSKKAAPAAEPVVVAAPVEEKAPEPAKPVETEKEPAPEVKKAIEYTNIQFEFNSSVLKTSSYAVLDGIAAGMKRFPELKYQIHGHASAEGTEARNLALSVDRANAVKNYLVNNGIAASSLSTVGNGEKFPVASNVTEEGRVRNRRVEIKPVN